MIILEMIRLIRDLRSGAFIYRSNYLKEVDREYRSFLRKKGSPPLENGNADLPNVEKLQ
ncbi:MAG: hypothetical protein IJM80_03920 [Firmicutes bacterium]|nr:hypothetical protein [Bacillota bacterium]